jgi:hypothetical protein
MFAGARIVRASPLGLGAPHPFSSATPKGRRKLSRQGQGLSGAANWRVRNRKCRCDQPVDRRRPDPGRRRPGDRQRLLRAADIARLACFCPMVPSAAARLRHAGSYSTSYGGSVTIRCGSTPPSARSTSVATVLSPHPPLASTPLGPAHHHLNPLTSALATRQPRGPIRHRGLGTIFLRHLGGVILTQPPTAI